MINNIIKLFYSEVVKGRMKSMPNEEYEFNEFAKKIKNIALKIDNYSIKLLKILLITFVLYLSFSINKFIGLVLYSLEIIYLIYKTKYEKKFTKTIAHVTNSIEISPEQFVNEEGKKGINLLITLVVISLILGFNYYIAISFLIVFIYTSINIYKVLKQE